MSARLGTQHFSHPGHKAQPGSHQALSLFHNSLLVTFNPLMGNQAQFLELGVSKHPKTGEMFEYDITMSRNFPAYEESLSFQSIA